MGYVLGCDYHWRHWSLSVIMSGSPGCVAGGVALAKSLAIAMVGPYGKSIAQMSWSVGKT